MFKSSAKEGVLSGDTVIAAGVKVEGDFTSEGNIVIEGEVVGSLKTAQDLQVGEHARIAAEVAASNARVAGEVRGNMTIREKLELSATARVQGDVQVKVLTVEAGAQLNGRVLMGAEGKAPVREKKEEASAHGLASLVGGKTKAERSPAG